MIISNTPPLSKFWSEKQKELYLKCLNDKKCTLAYYFTSKKGFPLHSPNTKGWKAKPLITQTVQPSKGDKIVPCSQYALHATFDVKPWI